VAGSFVTFGGNFHGFDGFDGKAVPARRRRRGAYDDGKEVFA
jgi:hypothetical protein